MECGVKVINELDFRKVEVPEALFELKVPKTILKDGARDAAEHFLTIAPTAGPLESGDIVWAEYPDDTAEGGVREVYFSAGRGFFDADAERVLLGALVGETREISVGGRVRSVTVVSIKRRHIPEYTDELIKRLNIEGVSTVEAYEKHLIDRRAERLRQKREQNVAEYVMRQVVKGSEFTPVDRERGVWALTMAMCRARARSAVQQLNAEYGEREQHFTEIDILREIASRPATASEAEVMEAIAVKCGFNAKFCALGMACAARNGVEFTMEEGEAQLRAHAQATGSTYEDLVASTGMVPELMAADKYIGYYTAQIASFFQDRYKVVLTD